MCTSPGCARLCGLKKFATEPLPREPPRFRRGQSDQYGHEAGGRECDIDAHLPGAAFCSFAIPIWGRFQPFPHKRTFSNSPTRLWLAAVHPSDPRPKWHRSAVGFRTSEFLSGSSRFVSPVPGSAALPIPRARPDVGCRRGNQTNRRSEGVPGIAHRFARTWEAAKGYVSAHLRQEPRTDVRPGALFESLWFATKGDECDGDAAITRHSSIPSALNFFYHLYAGRFRSNDSPNGRMPCSAAHLHEAVFQTRCAI
jgi:hypothetical protein